MIHYQAHGVTLHHGDALAVLATLPDNSVDAVVTDPPYGLEFMRKEWDAPWKSADPAVHAEARTCPPDCDYVEIRRDMLDHLLRTHDWEADQ